MINLDIENWQYFKIKDIFHVKWGKRFKNEDHEDGDIAYIAAGIGDNGVDDYIATPNIGCIKSNFISINIFGKAYYQDKPTFVSDSGAYIWNSRINKYIGLFISTILSKEMYRYTYGSQLRTERLEEAQIKLPSKLINGKYEPDWERMEKEIRDIYIYLSNKAYKVMLKNAI